MTRDSIKENIEEILKDIDNYSCYTGDDKNKVKLLPVTKNFGFEEIEGVISAGFDRIGENRVRELLKKEDHFKDRLKYHLIGPLQTNKIKQIIGKTELIHSVDRIKVIRELDRRSEEKDLVTDILLEINISKEESKTGFFLEDMDQVLDEIEKSDNLRVKGLMTMAPYEEDVENCRYVFRELRELFDKIASEDHKNCQMEELSMGMSHDYKIALEEGATIIRVGSKIFGERDYSNK